MRPPDEAAERKNGKSATARRAAKKLLNGALEGEAHMPDERIRDLVHELSVHQVELELQNEELRRAQHALEASQQKFQDLYDRAPAGYVSLDRRAVVEEANLTIAEMLGVATRTLLGAPFVLHVDPASRGSFFRFFRTALASETGESGIASLRRANGTVIAVRLDSRLERRGGHRAPRVHLSCVDVTRQKNLEEEVALGERRLRIAVEQHPAGFVIFDRAGRIEFANTRGSEILGRSLEALLGVSVRELSPRIPDAYVEALRRAVQTNTPQRLDGALGSTERFRDYVVTFAPVVDRENRVRQVLSFAYDDSAQKRVREDLEEAVRLRTSALKEALRETRSEAARRKSLAARLSVSQEKLRALSAELALTSERERQGLAATLHDRIGQALAFSKISLELARRSLSDDGVIGQLDQVISVLAQIIDEIQTMIFDLNPPVLSLLGLGPALEWLADKMQDEHGLSTAVTHEGEPLPLDDGIGILLFRAAKELLTNVVKHSGSRVARVSVRRAGRGIRMLVEDDGVGMPLRPKEPASGFGLFNIQERLLGLGGRMTVDSKPGGTRVLIAIPPRSVGNTRRAKSHSPT